MNETIYLIAPYSSAETYYNRYCTTEREIKDLIIAERLAYDESIVIEESIIVDFKKATVFYDYVDWLGDKCHEEVELFIVKPFNETKTFKQERLDEIFNENNIDRKPFGKTK